MNDKLYHQKLEDMKIEIEVLMEHEVFYEVQKATEEEEITI